MSYCSAKRSIMKQWAFPKHVKVCRDIDLVRSLIAGLRSSSTSAGDTSIEWLEENFSWRLANFSSVRQSTNCCGESEACYIPQAANEVCFLGATKLLLQRPFS